MLKNFHRRINEKRLELGYTTQDVGNRIGLHAAYIDLIESGQCIPKPEVAVRIAKVLSEKEEDYVQWAETRIEQIMARATKTQTVSKRHKPPHPRYPEAREALIALCEEPTVARQLFDGSAMGPLEAALYGLLIDRMSHQMADLGFWGFLPPRNEATASNSRLLLDAFFEMLTHPEGEVADYKKVFSEMIRSWRYGPGPHRITVQDSDGKVITYRLALVDQEGSIIPALEPEDPFHALYRMLSAEQRAEVAEIARVILRRDSRIEIQAALEALARWHQF